MGFNRGYDIFILVLVLILSLGIRIHYANQNEVVDWDAIYYLDVAENLFRGNGLQTDYSMFFPLSKEIPSSYPMPPLYPILLFLLRFFSKNIFFIAKMFNITISMFVPILYYILIKKKIDYKYALLGATLLCLNFSLIAYSSMVLKETLVVLLETILIFLVITTYKNKNDFFVIILAILSGILCLVTLEGGLLSFGVLLYIFFQTNKTNFKIKKCIIFILVLFLVVSPWFIYNIITYDSIIPYGGDYLKMATPTFNEIDEVFAEQHLDYNPSSLNEYTITKILYLFFVRFIRMINTIVFQASLIIFLLFIGGVCISFKRVKSEKYHFLLFYFILVHSYIGIIRSVDSYRYLVPLVPLIVFYSILFLRKIVVKFGFIKNLNLLVILFLVIIAFSINYNDAYEYIDEETLLKEVGNYLKMNQMDDGVITSYSPYIAYYASSKWIPLPYVSHTEFVKLYDDYNVSYLIFYLDEVNKSPAVYNKYYNRNNVKSDFRILNFTYPNNDKIIIYERYK